MEFSSSAASAWRQYYDHHLNRGFRTLDKETRFIMRQLYFVVHRGLEYEQVRAVNGKEVYIGRKGDCDLWLPDSYVSRKHALLTVDETGFRIKDLGSRNGTFVNGHLISREETITSNAKMQVGPYSLILCDDKSIALRLSMRDDESTQSDSANAISEKQRSEDAILTPAQQRVYELFVQGLIEKEIAVRLKISPNTVHDHAKAIYKAFDVSTRGELIARWVKQGARQMQQGTSAGRQEG